jgi:hypothetical protein
MWLKGPLEAVDAEVANELAAMNKRSFVRKVECRCTPEKSRRTAPVK